MLWTHKIATGLILILILNVITAYKPRKRAAKMELSNLARTMAGANTVSCGESTDNDTRQQYQKFQSCLVQNFRAKKTIIAYTEDHDMSLFAQFKPKVQITCQFVIIRSDGTSQVIQWNKDQGQSSEKRVSWSTGKITNISVSKKGSGEFLEYD